MASTTVTPPAPTDAEAKMTQELAQDRPTIDAAIKAFMSMVCAKALTASASDKVGNAAVTGPIILGIVSMEHSKMAATSQQPTHQQALHLARAILQAVNAFSFPIHQTVASTMAEKQGISSEKQNELFEFSIVAQLWNGLVESKQKPSRFLGRRALRHTWKQLEIDLSTQEDAVVKQQEEAWLQEFERLLFHQQDDTSVQDDDAALIWEADGGRAELTKRRLRRQAGAAERADVTPS